MRLITAILFITILASGQAQINTKKLNQLFEELYSQGDFNGTVLVAKGEQILFSAHYGFSDFEKRLPITDSTVFELASMGKQFTAMAIMILQERKRLNYDDEISEYLPTLPYQNITIRHLLTMTSGISDYLNFSSQWDTSKIASNDELVEFYSEKKPQLEFSPGDQFKYANINYVLLAEIIEQVSKVSFADFLKENIFQKLGMSNTRSYTTRFTKNEIIPNYAFPYVSFGGEMVKTDLNEKTKYIVAASAIEGDGSIVSTTRDLLKWTQSFQTNLLVSKQTLAQAYSPSKLNNGKNGEYGFGMYVDKNQIWHWGGWPGIQTSYTRYLDKDVVTIYLKNVASYNWDWIKNFNKLLNK